ncbi:NAD(P)-binding protein [Amniculicola lignicola CBS 123094]|uniref:NAD(P)-binding protein n=1 Tax=Amniculicola lignicola CBS 123094 TaxID=1392246 RepID=A0A6A5WKE0_9PLEO|nr:NAD(P)-binding protein [Amniculicola lignicola CBS 123094]
MPSSKELPPSTAPWFPNQFITNQFRTKHQVPPKDTDLSGKCVILTGANVGLGFECAHQLLFYKASRLIMGVRSSTKGEAAAAELRRQYPKANIEVWVLDMSSYDSVRAFAARAGNELHRLDIAIMNAGMAASKFQVLPGTGHEETVQVNYYSTMLLSILLLPVLKQKSPVGVPGRLTIVTSMLSIASKFPQKKETPLLPSFDDKKFFDPVDIYPASKFLGQLFTWKLTDFVSADDVVVNLVEPGFIKGTALHRDVPAFVKPFMYLFKASSARTMKVGASTYIDAVAVKGKESHGCCLMNWDITPYAPFQYTPEGKEVMDRLWRETLEEFNLIGVDANGILKSS